MYYYLKYYGPVLLAIALVCGGSYYWYFNIHKTDGVPCERNIHCPHRACIEDQMGRYCSRHCSSDEECLEGWRCLQPPGRGRKNACIRPAE